MSEISELIFLIVCTFSREPEVHMPRYLCGTLSPEAGIEFSPKLTGGVGVYFFVCPLTTKNSVSVC